MTKTRKRKVANDTPLFDEVAYNRILKSIDEQLVKLQDLQKEILITRAKQRGEFMAENQRRETEDRRMIRAALKPLALPIAKKTRSKKKPA